MSDGYAPKGIPAGELRLPYIRFVASGTKRVFYLTQRRVGSARRFALWRPAQDGYVLDSAADELQTIYERVPNE